MNVRSNFYQVMDNRISIKKKKKCTQCIFIYGVKFIIVTLTQISVIFRVFKL